MMDDDPGVDEISGWRELLDGMGQLTTAWESIEQSRAEDPDLQVRLPVELVVSLTRAAQQSARALAGLSELMSEQETAATELSAVADAQGEAADAWAAAHDAASS